MSTTKHAISFIYLFISVSALSQPIRRDSSLKEATVDECVKYALNHQPVIQKLSIDERITDRQVSSRLADWYPQVGFAGSYQHYFELPRLALGADSTGKRQIIQTGIRNTSTLGFSATQNLFNRDVLLASRSAGDIRQSVQQNTTRSKIEIAVSVSKAFYNILTTEEQIALLQNDTARLARSLRDAYNQYKGGIVDKIDYKRATIALNNGRSQMKQYQEQLLSKYSYLKYLMGYPQESDFDIQYDSLQLQKESQLDTLQQLTVKDRIEYRQLETQRRLLKANLQYNRWSYLPTLSVGGYYNIVYLNENFKGLFNQGFPNSHADLSLNIPLFQGFRRVHQIRAAELQLQRNDWDFVSLQDSITNEYTTALSNYKGALYDYGTQKENVDISTEVYNAVELQYKAGVKTYLEVIVAQSDLRTSQVNATNALYALLVAKLDVEKAVGAIRY